MPLFQRTGAGAPHKTTLPLLDGNATGIIHYVYGSTLFQPKCDVFDGFLSRRGRRAATKGELATKERKRSQRKQTIQVLLFVFFALQSVRITHVREDFFSRRERGERGATTGKEIRQGLFLRALRLCAHLSLPARFWLRRAVPGRGI